MKRVYFPEFESRITLTLFDKQGNMITRVVKDTSKYGVVTRSNPIKILQKVTRRAIRELLERINSDAK